MGTIIGLIIAFVVAHFVYNDATKRGMNAMGWALGTFLLMILFLPIYLIIRTPIITEKDK